MGLAVLRLDGAGWLEVAEATEPLEVSALTVEAWLRPDDERPRQCLVALESGQGPLLELRIQGGGYRFGSGHHWVKAPLAPPTPGGWRHVAAVCDGRRLRLHRHGETVEGPRAGCALKLTGRALLGARRGGRRPDAPYRGLLARVRIWRRALERDEAERSAHLDHLHHPTLLADWRMDEGDGDTVHNQVGDNAPFRHARLRGNGDDDRRGFRIAVPG